MTKAIKFLLLILRYLIVASWIKFTERNSDRRLLRYCNNASRHARLGLKVLGFDVRVYGAPAEARSRLVVSNHMSYLDVLIMAAVRPSVFVTSVDMGEVFFLGTMAEFAGSIFVERRHRGQVEEDKSAISEALAAGHDVVLYPEGTSTDGSCVLPFKKSLLMAAQQAGVDIQPVMLRYRTIDGRAFDRSNHQAVCWYGKMSFLPHILNLFTINEVVVELRFLPVIDVSAQATRTELAECSHYAIQSAYFGNDSLAIPI